MAEQMPDDKTLLPANSTDLEYGLETVLKDSIYRKEFDQRLLWDADNIPVDLIPWLAWGLSIDDWDDSWDEHIKREKIKNAIPVSRKKGTMKSIEEAVSSFGASSIIVESHDIPGNNSKLPFYFEVILYGAPLDVQSSMIKSISHVKPARSYFDIIEGVKGLGSLNFVGIGRVIHLKRFNSIAK